MMQPALTPTQAREELAKIGKPLSVLADCIRGFLIAPPGKKFVAVDFNAIEARVLAWLAGEESVLYIFRTTGKIYEHAAAGIFRVQMFQVTPDQRQIGKVAVLALGYAGGKGAFSKMAKGYGISITEARAESIKQAWRQSNPRIVRYWYDLRDAATSAVKMPGTKHAAGFPGRHVVFKVSGSFLWCKLPSGRVLCYPYPRIEMVDAPWTKETGQQVEAVTYLAENTFAKKSERVAMHGGIFCENVVQAVSRDLLANAMLNLDDAGFDITIHAHDECVVEVPETDATALERVRELMCSLPPWANDLPIAAGGWEGARYRK